MWIEASLYLTAIALAVYVYGLRPFERWKYRKFPGPPRAWLLGSAASLLSMGQVQFFKNWSDIYGPQPYAVALASDTVIVLPDPEDARKALLHTSVRPNMGRTAVMPRSSADADPADSLLWARGEKWRSLRAAWQPVFFSGSLKGYTKIMDAAAKLLVEEMEQMAGSKDKYFDVQPMVQAMTMNVIGQSAFGVDLHTQKADKAEQSGEERQRSEALLKAARAAVAPSGNSKYSMLARFFPFMVHFLRWLVKRFPDREIVRFCQARDLLREMVDGLLRDHQISVDGVENGDEKSSQPSISNGHGAGYRAKTASANSKLSSPEIRKGVKPGSFIDLLVRGSMRETGLEFTQNEKAQQVLLMLMAGYETSANTLVFAIYLLARSCNFDKQEKAIEEIDGLGRDYTPDYEDLEKKTPYLDAVIKESLRLFPPAHMLLRATTEELYLGGQTIPRDQMVLVSSYALHNDQKVWGPSVEDFLPSRWLAEDPDSAKAAKQNFFAFGDGPRVCPGSRFALLEIKIALIHILQHFTLHLAPHQEPLAVKSSITLGAKNGVHIEVQPRVFATAA